MRKIMLLTTLLGVLGAVGYGLLTARSLPPVHLTSWLPAQYGKRGAEKGGAYLLVDVSDIPMNRDTILPHQNVLIEAGRITQIVPASTPIDSASRPVRIRGTGKYLIPGLTDMHVHINDENNLLLFVANGVTTVRNMAGYPFHLALRKQDS